MQMNSTRPCLGGWCARRDACAHHVSPTNRADPAERLCDRGNDGFIDGFPVRVNRSIGTWERRGGFIDLLQPAGPFDWLLA
jgi:hypothetical protein